jgi:hypothetical protein
MNTTDNLLGTVIFEPNNPKGQLLIIKDLESDIEKEYPLEHGFVVLHDGKRIPVNTLLSESNAQEIHGARIKKQYTSFMLSRSELEKAQQLNLIP